MTTTTKKQIAVDDIGSAEDFLAAVEATLKFFNDGELISGVVVKIDRDEVLLDVGYKTEGVIPSRELSIRHDADPSEIVSVGDAVEALVLQKEDKEGRLILSKKRAQYERAWGDVEKIKEADGTVTGTVIEVVKGGLIVDIGLRGFLPASLIELRRVRDLGPYLGQSVETKILELDKNRNNVVLSRRALLEQSQSASRSTFLADLAKGQIAPVLFRRLLTSVHSLTLVALTVLFTFQNLAGSTLSTPAKLLRSAKRLPLRFLKLTKTVSAFRYHSRQLKKTHGRYSLAPTQSVSTHRARSPSWFHLVHLFALQTASRV
jgi:predicted RNA-binding protein with RPS1 domain